MSYLVIARKYRPQTFADLTGQEHITRTLSFALDQQRLHHAYLFSGVRGTGKTTSARILAKGLNCHKGITSQPCLQCASCLEIAAGNSLDVLEIDAASNTGVDNVRDVIINNIAIAPARDRHKVFVIDEVHMLSNSAFNALLKTLEEPPSHVVFIMATTELHKVPDTILSRCQQFEFRQIPTDKIFQRLNEIASAENISIPEEALREIARAGAGSLRDAQSAFDQVIAFSGGTITAEDVTASLGLVGAKTLGDFAEAIATQNTAQLLTLIESISARGYDLRNFARELMTYFRHMLVIKSGITSAEVIGVADVEVARLQTLAKHFSEEDLVRSFHLLADTEKEIKDAAQPRFALELGLVKLTHATRLQSLVSLIERLTALETSFSSDGGFSGSGATGAGNKATSSFTDKTSTRAFSGDRPSSTTTKLSQSLDELDNLALPNMPTMPAMPPSLKLPSMPETPKVPTISAPPKPAAVKAAPIPVPAKPSSPAAQALSAPPAWSAADEPPDFPDFEPLDVPDWDEPDFAPRGNAHPAPRPNASPARPSGSSSRPYIEAGQEIEAIRKELENRKQHLLVTALEDAQIHYETGLLQVTMANDDAWAKRLRDAAATFRDIGTMLFGQPLRLEVVINGNVASLINEAAQERAAAHEKAKQNPAVKMVLDKFKGEIVSVRSQAAQAQ